MKKTFILHVDSLSILEEMTNEQKGILFDAIYKYQLGKTVELDFAMKMAFAPFKNQFIRDEGNYNNVVERNRLNGKNGGRPRKETQENPNNPVGFSETQTTQANPKNLDSDSKSDSDSKKDSDKKEDKSSNDNLLSFLNSTTGKGFKVITSKAEKNIKSRLKEGFTFEDIKRAIVNCSKNKYHIENPQYLTLEFITRADNLEKYLNVAPAQMVALRPHDKGFNPVSYANIVN